MSKHSIIFAEERRQDIVALVNKKGNATVDELGKRYGVSLPTIRADLAALESKRLIRRTHGGAIPAGNQVSFEPTNAEKEIQNVAGKKAIAKAALKLINPGDVIAIDAGTTTRELADYLVNETNITVITNDFKIAETLECSDSINVVLVGGNIRKRYHCTVGSTTVHELEMLYVDKVFIGANAVSAKRGLSTPNSETAEVKTQMIKNAGKCIAMIDSSKIGNEALCKFADLKDVDVFITDEKVPTAFANAVKKAGAELIKVK